MVDVRCAPAKRLVWYVISIPFTTVLLADLFFLSAREGRRCGLQDDAYPEASMGLQDAGSGGEDAFPRRTSTAADRLTPVLVDSDKREDVESEPAFVVEFAQEFAVVIENLHASSAVGDCHLSR